MRFKPNPNFINKKDREYVFFSILQYLFDNYQKTPNLNKASLDLKIPKSRIKSLFYEFEPSGYRKILYKIKISKAKQNLTNEKISIKDVAFKSGFKNRDNFEKSFLRHVGIRPALYRKNEIETILNTKKRK